MMTPEMIAKLAAQAAETEDQTETTSGGDFEYEIPAAGKTIGRLIEYIELGKHGQKPYQNKPKPDADVVRLTFELLHPTKNIKEIEVEGEKKKITDRISVTLTKKFGEKAGYKKLFNKMTYGRADIKHMAQMLGEGFIIDIVHNTVKNEQGEKTYANMKTKEGEWLISAPFVVDPLTEARTNVPIPEALSPLRLFLFDHPTQESWDSLFIDGTRTVKDAKGVESEVSKNWLQERILSAKNYAGSPLNLMLDDVDVEAAEKQQQEKKPDAKDALAELDTKAGKVETASSDDLAALGLS